MHELLANAVATVTAVSNMTSNESGVVIDVSVMTQRVCQSVDTFRKSQSRRWCVDMVEVDMVEILEHIIAHNSICKMLHVRSRVHTACE